MSQSVVVPYSVCLSIIDVRDHPSHRVTHRIPIISQKLRAICKMDDTFCHCAVTTWNRSSHHACTVLPPNRFCTNPLPMETYLQPNNMTGMGQSVLHETSLLLASAQNRLLIVLPLLEGNALKSPNLNVDIGRIILQLLADSQTAVSLEENIKREAMVLYQWYGHPSTWKITDSSLQAFNLVKVWMISISI